MPIAQFSGLASGIDSGALIDAIIEARQTTNVIRTNQISHLESENDSLDDLNTKILALNDLVDEFRTINGKGVRKKATSSDATVVTASAGSDAVNASINVGVVSLANNATHSFNQSYSSTSDVVHATNSGSIDIQVGQGDDRIDISVDVTANDTTIQDVVDAINTDSNASGRISASLLNVGTEASPDYRMVFNTLQSGEDKGYLGVTTSVLSGSELSQATNAEFSLDGINGNIVRSSNTVDDVINGVTLQLLKSGSSSSVTVTDDVDATADLFNEIVEAYNEIVEFIAENDTVERVEKGENNATNIFGSLAKNRVDDDFLFDFRSKLLEADSENGTNVKSISEIGISTNRDGTLSFDIDDFKEAVGNDSLGVQEVLNSFADSAAGVSGFMYDYTKLNGIIDTAQDANDSEIENLNDAIDRLNRQTDKQRDMLELKYARLESTMARLQSQQAQLTSVMASLG